MSFSGKRQANISLANNTAVFEITDFIFRGHIWSFRQGKVNLEVISYFASCKHDYTCKESLVGGAFIERAMGMNWDILKLSLVV